MTMVELVRHAEARSRDDWWGKPDRDRPLTERGAAQARALARELTQGKPVTALHSSPFARCVQTLAPLAGQVGLPVVPEEILGETRALPHLDAGEGGMALAWLGGRAIAFLDRVVQASPGGRVVACSHGDVIPALMVVLAGRDGLDVDDVRLDKGAWFTLMFDGPRCVEVARAPVPSDLT